MTASGAPVETPRANVSPAAVDGVWTVWCDAPTAQGDGCSMPVEDLFTVRGRVRKVSLANATGTALSISTQVTHAQCHRRIRIVVRTIYTKTTIMSAYATLGVGRENSNFYRRDPEKENELLLQRGSWRAILGLMRDPGAWWCISCMIS